MAQTVALSKILNVREKEKKDAQQAYHHSMEVFEEIATTLYHLLRKKESAEQSYEKYLQADVTLDKLREQNIYIENLNKQILELQNEVQKARKEMDLKQRELTEAYVEVKKFEKIIETRQQEMLAKEYELEKKAMDEVSIRQYYFNTR